MNDDEVTMSIRKFLKKVGITSQQEIEKVYIGKGKVKVKMVLSCEELNLEHVIEGEIGGDEIVMTSAQKLSFSIFIRFTIHTI